MYHDYHIKINNELWNRIVAESKNKNVPIRTIFIDLLYKGLMTIYKENDRNEKELSLRSSD